MGALRRMIRCPHPAGRVASPRIRLWALACATLALLGPVITGPPSHASPAATPAGLRLADARTGLPSGWRPGPETFGVGEVRNVAIPAADGAILRADVHYPLDPDGRPAKGPFPVLLTETPYGSGSVDLLDQLTYGGIGPQLRGIAPTGVEVLRQVADAAGAGDYFVKRGYIQVIANIRGTGASGGQWSILNPVERDDSRRIVDWAAALPNSTGQIGMYGLSYLGMDSLLTAGTLEKNSPVKALFPLMPGNSLFEDIINHDGYYNTAFLSSYAWTPGTLLPEIAPILSLYDQPAAMLQVMADHLKSNVQQDGVWLSILNALTGGDKAYNGSYWQQRSIDDVLGQAARNDIPTYLVAGQDDLLQDGTPRTFAALQNGWAKRPLNGPMDPHQPVTGRDQMLFGPWFHVQPGIERNTLAVDLHAIELAWFDRWLKGERNGIDDTPTPLHAIDLHGYVMNSRSYPAAQTKDTTFYLDAGGALTSTPPEQTAAADPLDFEPIAPGTICNRSFSQNFSGVYQLLARLLNVDDPCATFSPQQGIPGVVNTLNYTSQPFTAPTALAGPIGATIYASSSTPASAFEVTVQDIGPDGSVTELTDGELAGKFRVLDPERSWRAPSGDLISPYHPDTRQSLVPVTPGQLTEYDIKIKPVFHVLEPGHRIQITIGTGDAPIHILNPQDYPTLLGGHYEIGRTTTAPSRITLPLAPANQMAG